MSSSFGTALKVAIFGQSHSEALGFYLDGLPAGLTIDTDHLARFMARRAPGSKLGTPRKEADAVELIAGLNAQGATCGAPLAGIIRNTNTRSGDYANLQRVPRPGHADFAAWQRWEDNHDIRGGGHFSGRLTAPLCAAGAIALQWLDTQGISIAAHISELASVCDTPFTTTDATPEGVAQLSNQMERLAASDFPTLSSNAAADMQNALATARSQGQTCGGIIECVAVGVPGGAGAPRFDSVESTLARALFGIPAVKGVEFGAGFAAAHMSGTEHNDAYQIINGIPQPITNHAGGILGGITTGAPVVVRCALKPIPSVMVDQPSVDLIDKCDTTLRVHGRHDTTAAVRAVPVIEAVVALALADVLLGWSPQTALIKE